MSNIAGSDIEPCSERFGSEGAPAAALVFGEMSQDSPEWYLPPVADAILGGTESLGEPE